MLAHSSRFRPFALAVAFALGGVGSVVLTGCASQPAFQASTPTAGSDAVLVEFIEQDDDVFKFNVYSRADELLLIQRDEVFLVLGGERIARSPGGLKNVYELPPGGMHDVFVAYDLARLEGVSEFSISFETALTAKGAPVSGPVFTFTRAAQ